MTTASVMSAARACCLLLLALGAARAHNNCKDRNKVKGQCAEMAERGDCDTSPGWMAVFCAHSCNMCELMDPEERCKPERMGMSMDDAFKPGELDPFFAGLKGKFPEYDVTMLSTPNGTEGVEGPWVARFENFITEKEIKALKRHTMHQLKRSTGQGGFDEDGVQAQEVIYDRTSRNAWCDDVCMNDKLVQDVVKRISAVTGVDPDNYESFQVLRYEKGQFYNVHHDTGGDDFTSMSGPRVLTFFMYLSDVKEGGGTNFPYISSAGEDGLTAHPKKGSAILWPSVTSDDLNSQLYATHHQALPVIKGVKYAANAWIHMRSYNKPNLWGCTGSFTEPEGDEDEEAGQGEDGPPVDDSSRQITIENDLTTDTAVSWVPPGGGENAVIKDRLGPKQSFGSNTFLGHVFEATDFVNKKPVSRFEVVDEVKIYRLSEHSAEGHDEL